MNPVPIDLDPGTVAQAMCLVQDETACLNRGDLDSWMALFSDDGYYWMPLEAGQTSPDEHDSLIYDNRALMAIRKNNLGHPLSPSMQTPVRSVRILSDPEVFPADRDDEIEVIAYVIAVIYHREQTYYAGKVSYRLQRCARGFSIKCKRVDLINADAPLDTIMM